MFRHLAVIWAVGAVLFVLLFAVYRLAQHSIDAISQPLSTAQWLLIVANVIFMAYSEGYRGFQKAFAPRFAARVRYIRDSASNFERLLAPLFCFGYFGTSKRRLIVSYTLSLGIILLANLAGQLDQPWRGIVDAGVVVGLIWGCSSVIYFVVRALTQEHYPYSAELAPKSS